MKKNNSLTGKKILITGASSGMGLATALLLAKAGATVITVNKNGGHTKSTAKKIAAQGGICLPFTVDLENLAEIVKFVKKLKKEVGQIDWLINSAGYIEHEEKLKDFSAMFDVNILAVIYLTRLLTPILKRDGGIINISSVAGIWGSTVSPAYSASKTALNGYSKLTAQNFTKLSQQLSCITICPGRTNTPMRQKIAGDAKLYQSPDVIAEAIEKIVTGQSKFKNGDMLIIKDGRTRLHKQS